MSTKKPAAKTARSQKPRLYRPPGSLVFPEARGKTLADLYFNPDPEISSVTIRFEDNTEIVLDLDIASSLVVDADYSDWKTGNQRVLRRWPAR